VEQKVKYGGLIDSLIKTKTCVPRLQLWVDDITRKYQRDKVVGLLTNTRPLQLLLNVEEAVEDVMDMLRLCDSSSFLTNLELVVRGELVDPVFLLSLLEYVDPSRSTTTLRSLFITLENPPERSILSGLERIVKSSTHNLDQFQLKIAGFHAPPDSSKAGSSSSSSSKIANTTSTAHGLPCLAE